MPITFDREEDAYQAWLGANPAGLVVNSERNPGRTFKLHRSTCWKISTDNGNFTTGKYIKTCALDMEALERWAREVRDQTLDACMICRPLLPECR